LVEAAGFLVIRAAASKGVFDLVAIDGVSLRCIQVKAPTAMPPPSSVSS